MRSFKQLSLLGLVLILGFSSCSIKKRIYMSGYHVEWKRSKHDPDKKEYVSKDKLKQINKDQIILFGNSENVVSTADNSLTENNILTSAKNRVVMPFHQTTLYQKNENTVKARSDLISHSKGIVLNEIKKAPALKQHKMEAGGGGGKSGLLMVICALILIGLGYLFYTTLGAVGLILFLIFGIGGTIFLIMGLITMM